MSLAVANSSPINPSLKSQVLIAYFGFSLCCGFALAERSAFAILGKCKAKLNIAFKLPCVQAVLFSATWCVKLEKSEFNRSLCKGCVKVQLMVSAVVVVLASAVVCAVASVPNIRQCRHCFRLSLIQVFRKVGSTVRQYLAVRSLSIAKAFIKRSSWLAIIFARFLSVCDV